MHAKLHLSQYKIFNVKTNTSDYTNSQVTPVAHISQQIQVQAIILWYTVHTELKKKHISHTYAKYIQTSCFYKVPVPTLQNVPVAPNAKLWSNTKYNQTL